MPDSGIPRQRFELNQARAEIGMTQKVDLQTRLQLTSQFPFDGMRKFSLRLSGRCLLRFVVVN